MDSLDYICNEALRQWASGRVLRAWLGVERLFPYAIGLDSLIHPATASLTAWALPLEAASKCHAGRGYRIEYSIGHGQRRLRQAVFDQPIDLIQYLGKDQEFSRFVRLAREIGRRLPALKPWVADHPMRVLEAGDRWPALLDRLELPLEAMKSADQDALERELRAELSSRMGERGQETP